MVYTAELHLNAEVVLPPEIQPFPTQVNLFETPRNIFLTGATGFVAAFILAELLAQTDARVYALVRANSLAQGFERIRSNLDHYLLWRPEWTERLIAVPGDLKLPLLGLSPEQFQTLAETIDVVYHVGSKLSYIAPYAYLKAANVGGTQETLRLATMAKAKPYHFVSSLGILLGYNKLSGGQEEDPLDPEYCPDVGYFQSKYVAEAVVREARDRGIPVTIHRIGLVTGDSRNGRSNVDDFVARILIGCIQTQCGLDITHAMDMTPVDYIARAVVYLSFQQTSLGRVFHILNPTPITWSGIFDSVMEAGYPVEKLPFQQWIDTIEEREDETTNPLHPLLPFFHINVAGRMLGVSDKAYHALGTRFTLDSLRESGIICPPVDRILVQTYLDEFVKDGRLHPAALAAAVLA